MLEQVEPECAEELAQVVAPWQLTLRQLSAGNLQPHISFTSLNDILVTNDRWQGCIHGSGGTAAGYVTLLGGLIIPGIPLNGETVNNNSLVCAMGNTEWDFVTPHGSNHLVVMIPAQKLAGYLQLKPSQILGRNCLIQHCAQNQVRRFTTLARKMLSRNTQYGTPADIAASEAQLELAILSLATELLCSAPVNSDGTTARARYAAYRNAVSYVNNSHAP